MSVSKQMLATASAVTAGINPTIIAFGTVGNTLCAIVYGRYRRVLGFQLQMLIAVINLLVCIAYIPSQLDVTIFRFSTNQTPSAYVYLQYNYPLMWYWAHLLFPLPNALNALSVFILLFQCADRIWAMVNPMKYNKHSKLHKNLFVWGSLSSCILLAILITIYDCWRFQLVQMDNGRYDVATSASFYTPLVNFCVGLRAAVRVGSAILIVIADVVIIVLYKKQTLIVPLKSNQQEFELKNQKKHAKTLTALLLAQSFLHVVTQCWFSALLLVQQTDLSFYIGLEFQLLRSLMSPLGYLATSTNFLSSIIVSKEFREMLKHTWSCVFKRGTVDTSSSTPSQRRQLFRNRQLLRDNDDLSHSTGQQNF